MQLIPKSAEQPVNSVQVAAVHLSAKGRICAQLEHLEYHPEATLVLCMSEKCKKENVSCANGKQHNTKARSRCVPLQGQLKSLAA